MEATQPISTSRETNLCVATAVSQDILWISVTKSTAIRLDIKILKLKAFANQVSSESEFDNPATDMPFTLTRDQYHQLLSLLKPTVDDSSFQSSIQSSALQVTSYNAAESNLPSMTGTAFCLSSVTRSSLTWIIDTGATDHMVHSKSSLTHIVFEISSTVKLPNGHFVPVTHIGHVKLSPTLTLTNVLFVPSFDFNLVSSLSVNLFEN